MELMRRAWALQAPGIALLCLTLGGCDVVMSGTREQASDTWSKKYPIGDKGRVEVVNVNGFVHLETSTGSREVVVEAERIARASTKEAAKALLADIEILEDVSADRVRLETKKKSTGVRFTSSGVEVRYTLHVPAGVEVILQTTNGGVIAKGATHGARLSTTNGQIEGEGLSGEVRATTTNGGVDLRMASVSDPVTVRTTNGGVSVDLPKSAEFDLNASCTNGRISVENLELNSEGDQRRCRSIGRVNGGGPRLELQTTNGGITIKGQ
jgi:DUF4097 and DUF4098 domain-containing protein YvlB